jgi:predicted enzyme related to lactoylglutathione lyase
VSTGAPVTLASANGDELRPHMIKRSSRRGGSMPPRQRGEPNGHSVIDGNPTKDAPTTLEDVAARGGPSVVRKGTRPPRASRIKRPHPQNSTMNHKFRPHQSGR